MTNPEENVEPPIAKDTVLEAVLAWARAERKANDAAIAVHARERVARNAGELVVQVHALGGTISRVNPDVLAARNDLHVACKTADEADEKMREIALAYIDQEIG